ncbi:toxin-antitoxin system YwqK family antitoxin [Labilibacter marinus]|uniref:toxin-antitoxin system YwqK family antitoxin n=1 Tax=Labilibacter marinus TaxID=1477105 RepID=UPI00094F6E17|nr:hypothetical protein [Labilibacter marinus]
MIQICIVLKPRLCLLLLLLSTLTHAQTLKIDSYPNGQKKAVGDIKDGKRDGDWTWYYSNGKIAKTQTYYKGQLHAEEREYNEQGQLLSIRNYYRGTKAGYWEQRDSLGRLEWYREYDSNGKQKGVSKSFYSNGKVRCVTYEANKDGYSRVQHFYKNGVLESEGEYYDTYAKTGVWIYYYSNGNIKEKGYCYTGRCYGIYKSYRWEHYYECGKLESTGSYCDDYREGQWLFYYKNGKLRAKGSYMTIRDEEYGECTQSYKDGHWEEFFESGALKSSGNYSEGEKIGEWFYYKDSRDE